MVAGSNYEKEKSFGDTIRNRLRRITTEVPQVTCPELVCRRHNRAIHVKAVKLLARPVINCQGIIAINNERR